MTPVSNKTLAQALLEAQREMPAIKPDTVNPHFKSEFVSLDRLLAVAVPILNKHGLVLLQAPSHTDLSQHVLVTSLIHAESGDKILYTMPLILEKENSQGQGSAITYARRYALTAMLGISGEKDDDGNAASDQPGAIIVVDKPKPERKSKAEEKPPTVFVTPPGADKKLDQKRGELDTVIEFILVNGWLSQEQIDAGVMADPGVPIAQLTAAQIDQVLERVNKFVADQTAQPELEEVPFV